MMEEFLTISYNFGEPVEVVVAGHLLTGLVEDLDDDRFKLGGNWYPIDQAEITHVTTN